MEGARHGCADAGTDGSTGMDVTPDRLVRFVAHALLIVMLAGIAATLLVVLAAVVLYPGTQLDTVRFRSLIAERLAVPPTQVSALIMGEHGDSMVPIWSSATAAGLPLDKFPGFNPNVANELFTRTKGSGAEVIKKKGGAGFAVGLAIQEVIESVALDRRRILPVSSVQSGCYGIRDVALSVPTVVERINNTFRRADEIQHSKGIDAGDKGYIDNFAPIVADAEAGFGGV
ncbi:MAG: hypothetical protein B7Z73_19960, partial [Planctomycetia bacterium 21-64-5]